MNKSKVLLSLFTLLLTQNALSTVIHWPECNQGLLHIKNKTAQRQNVWLQTFDPTLKTEDEFEILEHQSLSLPLTKNTASERQTLLHFENSNILDVTFECNQKYYPTTSIEGGVQTFRKSDLIQQRLILKNISSMQNKFTIEVLNRYRQPLRTIIHLLRKNEQRRVLLLKTDDLAFVRIRAENKFVAFNINSQGSQNALIADVQIVPENNQAPYFEVAPKNGFGDSFIVQISNPQLIAKARQQVEDPSLEKIIFARIKKGHNHQNRNLASVTKSFWNWSATEVTNISDLGSTACNALPQIVEDRIDFWVKDPGRICFWTYRIKREVPALEIATGQKIN